MKTFRPATAIVLALGASTLLMGCSNAEDKFYDSYKCGRVADMVGQHRKAVAATMKAEAVMNDLPEKYRNNESQVMMHLNTRFTDDLALYKLSPMGQGKAIMDTYESGTCQKLYK